MPTLEIKVALPPANYIYDALELLQEIEADRTLDRRANFIYRASCYKPIKNSGRTDATK